MNPIRQLRAQAGITQQELAAKAGTSQPTIAFYESGSKSPTLSTLKNLASSLGLEVVVTFTPQLSREDQRSLVYHRAIIKMLEKNPSIVLNRARRTLNLMKKRHQGATALFDAWAIWLNLPMEELISKILDPSLLARDMRQVSPFAGLLNAQERAKLLTQFRKDYCE